MVITAQITPNGKVTEMSSEEADEQKGERIYSGAALNAPEHWEHKRYRLTMTMLGTFDCEEDPCGDELSVLATAIYRRVRSNKLHADYMIYGQYIYRQRERRRTRQLYKGRSDLYLQAGIKAPNSDMT